MKIFPYLVVLRNNHFIFITRLVLLSLEEQPCNTFNSIPIFANKFFWLHTKKLQALESCKDLNLN